MTTLAENMGETWESDAGRDPLTGRLLPGHSISQNNRGGGRPPGAVKGVPDELRECLKTLFAPDDLKRLKERLMQLLDDPKVTGMALIQLAKLVFELVGGKPGASEFKEEIAEVKAMFTAINQRVEELSERQAA
jgi:hypothetical protein